MWAARTLTVCVVRVDLRLTIDEHSLVRRSRRTRNWINGDEPPVILTTNVKVERMRFIFLAKLVTIDQYPSIRPFGPARTRKREIPFRPISIGRGHRVIIANQFDKLAIYCAALNWTELNDVVFEFRFRLATDPGMRTDCSSLVSPPSFDSVIVIWFVDRIYWIANRQTTTSKRMDEKKKTKQRARSHIIPLIIYNNI